MRFVQFGVWIAIVLMNLPQMAAAQGRPNIPASDRLIQFGEVALPPLNSDWQLIQLSISPVPEIVQLFESTHEMPDGTSMLLVITSSNQQTAPEGSDPETYRETLIGNNRRGCPGIEVTRFDYQDQVGERTLCRNARPSGPEFLAVTHRRHFAGDDNFFTISIVWRGPEPDWERYTSAHPNYADDWNQRLDQITFCDLTEIDATCAPLGINDGLYPSIDPRHANVAATSAPRGSTSMEPVAVLSVRPPEGTPSEMPASWNTLSLENHPWESLRVVGMMTRDAVRNAEQNRNLDFLGVYTQGVPSSDTQIIEDRIRVATMFVMIYWNLELEKYQRQQRGQPLPDFQISINFSESR